MEISPQIRIGLFKQIHEIVFHGKGGYDYDTVYHMPIWLRKFTYNELKKFYDAEAEATKSASKKSNQTNVFGVFWSFLKLFASILEFWSLEFWSFFGVI